MRLLFPKPDPMKAAGFASISHVPFLLDTDGTYLEEPNRYLRERALLEWRPSDSWSIEQRSSRKLSYPTVETLRTLGSKLKRFLLWCKKKNIDWRNADYTRDVVFWLQADLAAGAFSAHGVKLTPSTANLYANEATLYLIWIGQKGYRDPSVPGVVVPRGRRRQSIATGKSSVSTSVQVQTRAGTLRTMEASLQLPTLDEVNNWLRMAYLSKGKVKGLAFELILRTGIRTRECVMSVGCIARPFREAPRR